MYEGFGNMLITRLKLNYFGRFQNKEIELKPGINLIYGDNEAGKSTVHAFIRGMLFGIERLRGRASASKEDIYARYLPWDYKGAYHGSMDLVLEGKDYRLQRSFHANDKSFTVLELATGREIKPPEGLINDLVPGLTESAFRNTISLEQQRAQTDAALAAEVRNYIANLSMTKSKEIDVAEAISSLTQQRKKLEASQDAVALKALQTVIEEGLEKEERIDQLTLQLRELLQEEQEVKEQLEREAGSVDDEVSRQIEQLPAIIEKYRLYRELLKQEHVLDAHQKELQDKIAASPWEAHTLETLRDDTARLQRLESSRSEQEKLQLELQTGISRLNNHTGKNALKSILPGGTAALLAAAAFKFRTPGILAALIFLIFGTFGFMLLNRKFSKKRKSFQEKSSRLKQESVSEKKEMESILYQYGVSCIEDLFVLQEEAIRSVYSLENAQVQYNDLVNRQKELEDSIDILYDTIMSYMQYFISEEELTDTAMQHLKLAIADRKQETSGKLSQLRHQQESCKLNIEKLRWEITALEGNEEELLSNQARYKEMEQMQREQAVELKAVRLALESIGELSAEIHDSFGQQLNQAVSEVISQVTHQKYTDLKVDEKLEVKVGWNGDYVPLSRLSAGTIDQVYFALRLAVADLLLGKDAVPLILDDSFAFYDEMRVREALLWLSLRRQVIIFTCHKREQRLLREMMVPYHYVDLIVK